MIEEPTGWELSCDYCITEFDVCESVDSAQELRDWARDEGWIVVGEQDQFCSLDCLLLYRARPSSRRNMARLVEYHMKGHEFACCKYHGTHSRPHSMSCKQWRWGQ